MTLLLDVAPLIPPAGPDASGAEIYRRFELEPDTLAIAIVDEHQRPIGLVERNAFLVLMAAQHGYSLWANRPISRVMKSDPLTVDGDVTVEDFCGSILQDRSHLENRGDSVDRDPVSGLLPPNPSWVTRSAPVGA